MVYPTAESALLVDDFAIPDHWPRAYGMDVRFQTIAAIWGALDPESDTLYLYSEYFAEADPAVAAAAIRARGTWIRGLIDPQANGRDQADGFGLMRMCRELGLDLQRTNNPLETGVLKLRQRMSSGRLKVFASLAKYREERRLYRRDGSDQIVRQHDNLQDAARCLVNGIGGFRTKPVKQPVLAPPRYTERSWMGWGG